MLYFILSFKAIRIVCYNTFKMVEGINSYDEIGVHTQGSYASHALQEEIARIKCHIRILFAALIADAFAFSLWFSFTGSLSDFTTVFYIKPLYYSSVSTAFLIFLVCGCVSADIEWVVTVLSSNLVVLRIMAYFPLLLYFLFITISIANSVLFDSISWRLRVLITEGCICAINWFLCSAVKSFLMIKHTDEYSDIPSFSSSSVVALHV